MGDDSSLYSPLRGDRQDIRLLELYYGNDDEDIRCHLITTPLEFAPPYEALSYTWGDPSKSTSLSVGKFTLEIRRNLDVALRHLRKRYHPASKATESVFRRLWIDALCINQDDIQERNQQVLLMFKIYQRAEQVPIWLGEESDDSNLAMDLISNMQEDSPGRLDPFESLLKLHGSSDGEHLNPQDPQEWKAFHKLMDRPWWRRIWVVQELMAAQGKAIVGCGSKWIPWSNFEGAAAMIAKQIDHPFLEPLRRLGSGIDHILNLAAVRFRMDGRLDSFLGLMFLLHMARDREATEDVDQIYALIGLTPSVALKPDYSTPVEQCYKSFAKLFVANVGNLGVLYLNKHPKRLDLPSWVPDFSAKVPDDAFNSTVPLGFFSADGNTLMNAQVPSPFCAEVTKSDGENELTLVGFQYDSPLVIDKVWEGTVDERDTHMFEILKKYEATMRETDTAHFPQWDREHRMERFWPMMIYHRPSETPYEMFPRFEAFFRTLVWNASPESRYPAPEIFGRHYVEITRGDQRLMSWTGETPKRVIPYGEARQYYKSLVKHALNRRFFITKKGHLASGPKEMRLDDLICVVFGSKIPVILRKSVGKGNSGQPCFELIGGAYVHGIMEGEALEALGEGHCEPQKFVLV